MILFFELIQLSLGNRNKFSHLLSEAEWLNLYYEARRHSIVGPLFTGVEKYLEDYCKDVVPSWAYQWMSDAVFVEKQNEIQINLIQSFITNLRERKYCVLKGQGVAALYDNPARRQCGDLDIWLEGNRLEILRYCSQFGTPKDIFYHHIGLGEVNGLDIEVHFTPSWMNNVIVNSIIQKWYKQQLSSVCQNEAKGINVPDLAFNRVYLLNHIYRHLFYEGIGLRQLMDYYYVLRHGFTEEERIESVRLIRRFRMLPFAKAVMYVMKEVFGLEDKYLLVPIDEKRGKFFLDEVLKSGNFGHSDSRNRRNGKEGLLKRAYIRLKHDFRFILQYPSEVLWSPIWKTYHYLFQLKYSKWK